MQSVRSKGKRKINQNQKAGGSESEDLGESLIHFLTREHQPIDRKRLIQEIGLVARENEQMADVPPWEWNTALDELIESGVVIDTGQGVVIDREAEERKRAQDAGMLF